MNKQSVCVVALLVASGCSTTVNETPPPVAAQLIWQSHQQQPDWVRTPPPVAANPRQFVGLSYLHRTERTSREAALANASTQALRHALQKLDKTVDIMVTTTGALPQSTHEEVEAIDRDQITATGVISGIAEKAYYTEQWQDTSGRSLFKSYALVEVLNDEMDALVRRFHAAKSDDNRPYQRDTP